MKKSVGKQLEEARLARHLTLEQVCRETKIKTDRLLDLEADNYVNFSSPTYARGFVRTYARFLGLDEYRLIRQLDNRIPSDEDAPLVTDSSVAYLPEPADLDAPVQANRIGGYILTALATFVGLIVFYVLVENYRAGMFGSSTAASDDLLNNAVPAHVDDNRATVVDTNQSPVTPVAPPRAEPVNLPPATQTAPKALPLDPANPPVAAPATTQDIKPAPRALPVDLNNPNSDTANLVPVNNVVPAPAPVAEPASPVILPPPAPKHLVLRATQDTHVRVACTDDPDNQQVIFDDVLRAGQTVGCPGRRFVIDVDLPLALDVTLDGAHLGAHSHGSDPETFTLESKQP